MAYDILGPWLSLDLGRAGPSIIIAHLNFDALVNYNIIDQRYPWILVERSRRVATLFVLPWLRRIEEVCVVARRRTSVDRMYV